LLSSVSGEEPVVGHEDPVLGRLLALAATTFKRDAASLSLQDSADTIDGWDSLNHLQLITSVESAFGIELGMVDVMRIRSLGDLLEVVERERALA
jgi:acyl carrier protein